MFVLWNWTWLEDLRSSIPESICKPESNSLSPEFDTTSDEDEEPNIPKITHTVVFKCIGAHKEREYQETLALASQKLKENSNVQVKLQPEPHNRYNAKAIAFQCKIDDSSWVRIGYVVQEVLDEVHEAINKKKILNVRFDWIKYIVHFKSLGWYAGIRIQRSGEWSLGVLCSHATSYTF